MCIQGNLGRPYFAPAWANAPEVQFLTDYNGVEYGGGLISLDLVSSTSS